MAPIRVGLMGLSPVSPGGFGPGSWAVSSHLSSYVHSPNYEIVAIYNSSVESARRSIEYHGLPSTTRAYGTPQDLADDPNVDLVVVSVFVTKHHMLAMPALRARKQVFVEWPLGTTTAEAEEMEALARDQGLKTVMGLQMRADPFIAKAKQLVDSGAIGTVTSTVAAFTPSIMPGDKWPTEAQIYLDYETRANMYHIGLGHFLDAFTYVVGDFVTTQSIVKNRYPSVEIIDSKTGETVNPAGRKSAPDHVFVQGELENGAVASVTMRKTPRSVDGYPLRWIISGSKGEIELTVSGTMLQFGSDTRVIRMTVGYDGETKEVDWRDTAEPDYVASVAVPGQNTARVLEAYAKGRPGFADFKDALKLHRLLDKITADANFP